MNFPFDKFRQEFHPSLLLLEPEEKGGKIDVYVGGKVVMIAKGEFL